MTQGHPSSAVRASAGGGRLRVRRSIVAAAALAFAVVGWASAGAPVASADDPPGFAITGTLVDPYPPAEAEVGAPIQNTMVGLYYLEATTQNFGMYVVGSSWISTTTDADGDFDLFVRAEDLLPGRSWWLYIRPPAERQGGSEPLGTTLLPLDLTPVPDASTPLPLGTVVLPEPNVRGTVRERPGSVDGDAEPALVPLVWASIQLSLGSDGNAWTPLQLQTSPATESSPGGEFAFHVAPDDLSRAIVRIDGGGSGQRDRIEFLTPIGDLSPAERLALALQYPEPNVTGRLTRAAVADDVDADDGIALGDPIGVGNASIHIERRNDTGDEVYWNWVSGNGSTESNGDFWLVHTFEPGETYRLSIGNGPAGPVTLPAFTVPLVGDEDGSALGLALSYPTPNLTGTVVDAAGAPVHQAWLQLTERVDDGSRTWSRWFGQPAETDADGRFAFFLTEERLAAYSSGAVLELHVNPPFARTGDLPTFLWPIPADQDDLLGLELVFPEPDVSGTLTAGGTPVQYAFIAVQQRVTDHGSTWWEWTNASSSTDADGKFALSVPGLGTDEFRLRIEYSPVVGQWARFTHPLVPGETTGMSIAAPEPNVSGTVLADLGEGPVPVQNAHIEVRRWASAQRSWEWTDTYGYTGPDGTFALVVDPETFSAGGELQLRVRPPESLNGTMTAFEFSLDGLGTLTGLTLTAPAANLSGVLRTPDGTAVAGAWFNVERETTESGMTFWQWVDAYGQTGPDGRFALTVPDADPDARYRVSFQPPWFARSTLVAFTEVLPGTGLATDLELAFPTPNVTGVLRDGDGAPVAQAWLSLRTWNEDDGYWEWGASATTSSAGTFALFASGDGEYRLSIDPPWDRGDLVRFDRALDLSDGPATGLDLVFPEPNLRTVLVDATGARVRGASVWIERRDPDPDAEHLNLWSSSDQQGRLSLLVPGPGEYRMHVSPPWAGSLPSFERTFSVSADGTVSGIGEELVFPTPNVVVEVLDGADAAVQHSYVEVRPAAGSDDLRWSAAWAATNRQGRASLLLEPGAYRIYVHPPWWAVDLAFQVIDVEVGAGDAPRTETVVLSAPNVRGTVDIDADRRAIWSWIEVETLAPTAGEMLPGTHVRPDGTFGLGLPTGEHLLRIYSSDARASSGPLEVVVTIDGAGDVAGWRYAVQPTEVDNCPAGVDPCTLALSFDDLAVRPNLIAVIVRDGDPVDGAFVTATQVDAADGVTPVSRTAVTDPDGRFRLLLPDGIGVTITLVLTDGDVPVAVEWPDVLTSGGSEVTLDVTALLTDAEAGS